LCNVALYRFQIKKLFSLSRIFFLFFSFLKQLEEMSFFQSLAAKVNDLFDHHETKDENPNDDLVEQQLAQEKHRFDSFAAVRHDAQVKYYVDGQNYCW
jgi:hypothetical protein